MGRRILDRIRNAFDFDISNRITPEKKSADLVNYFAFNQWLPGWTALLQLDTTVVCVVRHINSQDYGYRFFPKSTMTVENRTHTRSHALTVHSKSAMNGLP